VARVLFLERRTVFSVSETDDTAQVLATPRRNTGLKFANGDVHNLVHVLHKRTHRVVGGVAVAEKHYEMVTPISAGASR
jgi:hypothetical protein